MTHYTRTWDCRICSERQESIDTPKMQICEACLTPVANRLCARALGVNLDTPGIDRDHWMREADSVVLPMMRRYRYHASVERTA